MVLTFLLKFFLKTPFAEGNMRTSSLVLKPRAGGEHKQIVALVAVERVGALRIATLVDGVVGTGTSLELLPSGGIEHLRVGNAAASIETNRDGKSKSRSTSHCSTSDGTLAYAATAADILSVGAGAVVAAPDGAVVSLHAADEAVANVGAVHAAATLDAATNDAGVINTAISGVALADTVVDPGDLASVRVSHELALANVVDGALGAVVARGVERNGRGLAQSANSRLDARDGVARQDHVAALIRVVGANGKVGVGRVFAAGVRERAGNGVDVASEVGARLAVRAGLVDELLVLALAVHALASVATVVGDERAGGALGAGNGHSNAVLASCRGFADRLQARSVDIGAVEGSKRARRVLVPSFDTIAGCGIASSAPAGKVLAKLGVQLADDGIEDALAIGATASDAEIVSTSAGRALIRIFVHAGGTDRALAVGGARLVGARADAALASDVIVSSGDGRRRQGLTVGFSTRGASTCRATGVRLLAGRASGALAGAGRVVGVAHSAGAADVSGALAGAVGGIHFHRTRAGNAGTVANAAVARNHDRASAAVGGVCRALAAARGILDLACQRASTTNKF